MDLEIFNSQNGSKISNEIILLKANEDVNLSGYAIVDKTFLENEEISNKFRHIYFFKKFEVKKNHFVALISGNGEYDLHINNGDTVHKFYWNVDHCIWNDEGDTAILLKIDVLQKYTIPPIKTT